MTLYNYDKNTKKFTKHSTGALTDDEIEFIKKIGRNEIALKDIDVGEAAGWEVYVSSLDKDIIKIINSANRHQDYVVLTDFGKFILKKLNE